MIPALSEVPVMNYRARSAGQRGVALMMALIAVFLLIIVTFEVEQTVRTEEFITTNCEIDTKMELGCTAGLEVALAKLREDRQQTEIDSLFDSWGPLIVHQDLREEDVANEEFLYLNEDRPNFSKGDEQSVLYVKIFDEAAKFNIYLLLAQDPEQQRRRKEMFSNLIDRFRADTRYDMDYGQGQELADRIITLLKRTTDQPVDNMPVPPVKAAGTLTDTSELRYTRIIPPEIFYDLPDPENYDRIIPGLYRYLTVWSDMQININTADAAGMAGIFANEDVALVDRIMEYRAQVDDDYKDEKSRKDSLDPKGSSKSEKEPPNPAGGAPFEQTNDLKEKVDGISNDVYNRISQFTTVQSNVFSVYVTAKRGIYQRTKMWVVRRTEQGPRILFERLVNYPYLIDPRELEESTKEAAENDRYSNR